MNRNLIVRSAVALSAFFTGSLHAAIHELSSPALVVRVDDTTGTFTVANRATGKTFISQGRLEGGSTQANVSGQAIIVTQNDGGATKLELKDSQPFVFITKQVRNTTTAAVDFAKVAPVTFTVDLGKPAAELRTLGTGGLLAPDKNPGSYLFLSCVDPATREGVVAGFATQRRGSGVIFSTVKDSAVEMKAQLEHGHLFLEPGKSATLDTVVIGQFADARIGLEQLADTIAQAHQIKLRPKTAVYCSWYAEGPNHGGAGTEETTRELASYIADKKLKDYGLGVIQLDDWWQDGPKIGGPATRFDRVNPNGPYKNGIAPVAKFVGEKGLTFGLWWLPFGRNHMEPDYKDKQDWFVKWPDGKPLRQKSFGGTCLDTTHPEVEKHLESLGRTIRSWGAKYYKMDGLVTGAGVDHVYINDAYKPDRFGECLPLHQKGMTNIEAMRHGLQTIRKGAGEDVFFSGCCAVQNMRIYAGSIGLVDSMRVGPDFNHDGEGIRSGPLRGSRVYFLNGKVWWNDPDPTKVRTSAEGCVADGSINGAVSLDQARLTSSWVSLTDQFFLISDWLPNLPEERLEILRRTMLPHGATTRPVDYFDRNLPNTWLVSDSKSGARRDVLGLFNFYSQPLEIDHTLARIGLDPAITYHAYDFWANQPLPDIKGSYQDSIAANSCRVIALRADEGHPVLLSTSRHVTQGMVDVLSEKWSGNTLSGVSNLIADDPYELRIHVPDGWKLDTATASVPVVTSESARLARVSFRSPVSGSAAWKVVFKPTAKSTGGSVSNVTATQPEAGAPVTLAWQGNAPLYEITRDGTVIAAAQYGCSYTDPNPPVGKPVTYTIKPIDGPPAGSASASATLTPKTWTPGPVPPMPDVELATLKPLEARVGWGSMQTSKAAGGGPLTLSKQVYQNGIGMHADGEAVYACKSPWKRFVAIVGLDDSQRADPRASIACQIVAEDAAGHRKVLARTPDLKPATTAQWNIDVTLPADCAKLRLVVDDAGDGNACDHANWVNAGFID